MLHAKTAVADGQWARVGSSNLNIASWLGNCELDVVAEDDEAFAREMERMYLDDLENATEVILGQRHTIAPAARRSRPAAGESGSAGRAAAGMLRIGNTVGAAVTGRRVLEPVEVRIMLAAAVILFAFTALAVFFPRVLAYPLAVATGWIATSLVCRSYRLRRRSRRADVR